MKFNVITPEQEANLRMKPRSTKSLLGVDGNAFSIMAHMKRSLQIVGWKTEDLNLLLKEMQSDDYDHLLAVACNFTDFTDEDEAEWDEEEEDEE